MAAHTRKKKANIITINPLKNNEFIKQRTIVTSRTSKPTKLPVDTNRAAKLPVEPKKIATLPVELKANKEAMLIARRTNTGVANLPEGDRPSHPREGESRRAVSAKQATLSTRILPDDKFVVRKYNIQPIIPAQKHELIPVAKAMHRNEFGSNLRTLFKPEKEAAIHAIETGVYVGWRCEEYTWDCIRLGAHSRCFCDHVLGAHETFDARKKKFACHVMSCSCKSFAFVPERPQDIGEWWLQKRRNFDPTTWRAKCKCKHSHVYHDPETKICAYRGCTCFCFKSDFLCAACDRHWEDHWTFFDTEATRKEKGLPVGDEYLPFHEMSELRDIIMQGDNERVSVHRGRIRDAINGSKLQQYEDG